ncbi:MAG: hypothetical protein WCY82_10910 [Desulfotomaculaceae bacterium]
MKISKLRQKYPDIINLGEVDCPVCGIYEMWYQGKDVFIRYCPTCHYMQITSIK